MCIRDRYKSWIEYVQKILMPVQCPDSQKFEMLKGTLEGAALRLVSHLPLEGRSIVKSIEMIKKEFGSVSKIVEKFLMRLKNFKDLKNASYNDVAEFCRNLEEAVQAIKISGKEEELYASSNVKRVINKLPENLQVKLAGYLSKKLKTDSPSLKRLAKWLNEELEALWIKETWKMDGADSNSTQKPRLRGGKDAYTTNWEEHDYEASCSDEAQFPVADVFFGNQRPLIPKFTKFADKAVNTKESMCPLHPGATHLLRDCQAFKQMSPTLRIAKVLEANFCIRCLKKHYRGPTGRSCPEVQKCDVDGCKLVHHKMLHGGQWPKKSNVSKPGEPTTMVSQGTGFEVDNPVSYTHLTLPTTILV